MGAGPRRGSVTSSAIYPPPKGFLRKVSVVLLEGRIACVRNAPTSSSCVGRGEVGKHGKIALSFS